MTDHTNLIDTTESVSELIERMQALTLDNTGGFWHINGDQLPW